MTDLPLHPPLRQTAADQAEEVLFRGIMDGIIRPGAALRLQELADRLDMSMMPIREAIRRLQNLGLVEIVAHKGAWVRPLTLEDLYDTYFTRLHLEAVALLTAAKYITPDAADRARLALDDRQLADSRGDVLASRDAHERFHFALYEASGSAWLVRSIWPVWRNSERYRIESLRNSEHTRQRQLEHGWMLDALEAGNGDEAVRLLVVHLRSSVDLVAATLQASDGVSLPELASAHDLLVNLDSEIVGTAPTGR